MVLYQNDFERNVLLKEGATSETLVKGNKDSVRSLKVIQVADIFREKLLEIKEEETGKLLNYIGNYVKMIKITCRDRSYCCKIISSIK